MCSCDLCTSAKNYVSGTLDDLEPVVMESNVGPAFNKRLADDLRWMGKRVIIGVNQTPAEVVEVVTKDGEEQIWILTEADCKHISENYKIVYRDGRIAIAPKKVVKDWDYKWPYWKSILDDTNLDGLWGFYNVSGY